MILSGQIFEPTRAILKALLADAKLSADFLYKHFQSQEYSKAVGGNVVVTNDYQVKAIEMRHTEKSVSAIGVDIQIGSTILLFNSEDLPEFDLLSEKDEIENAKGRIFKVKHLTPFYTIAVGVSVS